MIIKSEQNVKLNCFIETFDLRSKVKIAKLVQNYEGKSFENPDLRIYQRLNMFHSFFASSHLKAQTRKSSIKILINFQSWMQ